MSGEKRYERIERERERESFEGGRSILCCSRVKRLCQPHGATSSADERLVGRVAVDGPHVYACKTVLCDIGRLDLDRLRIVVRDDSRLSPVIKERLLRGKKETSELNITCKFEIRGVN
jgi:hypothetical protein